MNQKLQNKKSNEINEEYSINCAALTNFNIVFDTK